MKLHFGAVGNACDPREAVAAPPVITPKQRQQITSARQSGALVFLLFFFLLLLLGPFLIGRFVYETRYNELKAGYDVASSELKDHKARLGDFEMASRLVA